MNPEVTPIEEAAPSAPRSTLVCFESAVRKHPCTAMMIGTGLGLATVFFVRAMAAPPRHPVEKLLEDIKSRLADIAQPAYARASALANDGANALHQKVDSLHLDTAMEKLNRGLRSLFH